MNRFLWSMLLRAEQAGAELGQAQLKLRFDLTSVFFENLLSLYPALEWKKSCNGPPFGSFSREK